MFNNIFPRRLAALFLGLLLALCAGCGSANEPAAETPEPSQAPAVPEPTAAASPTDVNAPAVRPPQTNVSIEREAPEYLQLITLGADFTLTSEEGQTLTLSGPDVSGSMEFTRQQLAGAGGELFSVLIPYSTGFGCEVTKVSGDWGFEFLATACPWCHCVAKGGGKFDGLEYETGKRLSVRTEPGAELELTLPVPDSGLGENGWIRLRLTAGESEVSLAAGENGFSYSGLDAGAPVLLDYGGIYSANGLDLAPESSSGSAFFGAAADGTVGFTAS